MGLIHGSDVRTRSGPAPAVYDGIAPAASGPPIDWGSGRRARVRRTRQGSRMSRARSAQGEARLGVKWVVRGIVSPKGADRRRDGPAAACGPQGFGCKLVRGR